MKRAILIVSILLAGCALGRPRMTDDQACRSYGLQYGTSDYAACRQNLVARRDYNQAQQMQQLGNTMQLMQQQSRPAPPQGPVYTNCSRDLAGNPYCVSH